MEEEGEYDNIIMIRGFPVCFPKGRKPFAPQLALMSKLLMGVQKGENCLLESPTGTGKTLALLCAALAWQRQQREHGVVMESDCEGEGGELPPVDVGDGKPVRSFDDFRFVDRESPAASSSTAKAPIQLAYEDSVGSTKEGPVQGDEERGYLSDDDVFESPKKKRQRKPALSVRNAPHANEAGTSSVDSDGGADVTDAAGPTSPEVPDTPGSGGGEAATGMRSPCGALEVPPASDAMSGTDVGVSPLTDVATPKSEPKGQHKKVKLMRKRAPRVYFCSRTHSQLNQVVAELRTCRTAFKSTSVVGVGDDGKPFSMALLASRKSTCINKEACSDPKGVDDACKRLLKEKACSYQRRAKWAQTKLPPVWDVEEAVRLGKENRACPYYTARDSLLTADLILCPYNYLVDPGVREIMGINLKDAVVIFDEAHNLEDSAREAASARLSLRALSNAADEMRRLGANSVSLAPSYELLRDVIVGVQAFLVEADGGLNHGSYEKAYKVFKGTEALGLMQSRAGVTSESLVYLKEALALVISEDAGADPYARDQEGATESFSQGRSGDVLSSGAVHVTSSLVKVLGFLLADGMENVEHYKMVVLREKGPWQPPGRRDRGRRASRGGGRRYGGTGRIEAMETYLCFWCQSAAVCFSEIDKQVHSIVLTSGTLSPLDSFAGELGIDFLHRLEAPHVINVAKQCLVTSVGHFGGVSLDARYANQNDLKYQDALGNALLQYARIVPGGMLAFFPSYGLMDKMHSRWEDTGLLQALVAIKAVHLEPRGQGKIDGVLADYYEDIKSTKHNDEIEPFGTQNGALMLAVARGKVSEGIDFSDDAARMCVIIGIPYPSSKDLQVTLKKEYQDRRRTRNPQLVGGGAWYNLQAFRAVNQAVGRCIRHRDDFGAIVLCDPRYASQSEATTNLSKWVRSSVKQCRTVEASLSQVDTFFRLHGHQRQDSGSSLEPAAGQAADPCPTRQTAVTGWNGAATAAAGCCGRMDNCEGGEGRDGRGKEQRAEDIAKSVPCPSSSQRTLSQMFSKSSTENGATPWSPIDRTPAKGRAASLVQGTNGRTALQLLSQAGTRRGIFSPSSVDTVVNPPAPNVRPDLVSGRPGGSFVSHNAHCTGGVLISEPAGGSNATENASRRRPRRVLVRGGSHLHRVATMSSADVLEVSDPSRGISADTRDTHVLLEAPRGWELGDYVSEGRGRWILDDRLVYAPLVCLCTGCDGAQIGEKAIGAGLRGDDLIGRAWFFAARMNTDGFDDLTAREELVFPPRCLG